MRHRQATMNRLSQMACMALLWLLAGFAGAAIEPHAAKSAATAIAACQSELDGSKHSLDRHDHGQQMCARIAEGISLTSESGQPRLGSTQARANRRVGGGRPMPSLLPAAAQHKPGQHYTGHYPLASSGVAYITSRACDYYVFALRRILD